MFRECQNNAGVVIAVTPWGSKSSTAKKLDELHGLGYHELHCESSVIAKYACNNEVTTSAEGTMCACQIDLGFACCPDLSRSHHNNTSTTSRDNDNQYCMPKVRHQ